MSNQNLMGWSKCLFGLSAWTLLAASANAQLQQPDGVYRRGMPDVLEQPSPVAPQDLPVLNRASFNAAYAKAGRPTIAVLWNREFTDEVQQQSASQLTIDHSRSIQSAHETARSAGHVSSQGSSSASGNVTLTEREIKSQQARRVSPVERVDLQMRSSFMQTMVASGVLLVDRNVVIRTTATKQRGGSDTQRLETDALLGTAKLLMEVLNTQDNASPTGWATYVSIKRLADGVVLAEGYMDGRAPANSVQQTPRFRADPLGGFRELSTKLPTIAEAGARVAEQTLARLNDALTR